MIGVVGLGKMGRAIAGRLEACGEDIIVWNRTPGREAGLKAEVAASPSALCAKANVILSVLSDNAALDAVYSGEGGILSGDLSGRTVVEFCTMSPTRARLLERQVTKAGGRFLECPVGGTVAPAQKGELLGLAGGSYTAFEIARPVLEHLTRRLVHIGPVGTGAAMKLSINLPLMVYWSALGEALGLAMGEGIDPAVALDILADSSGAIGVARMRVPSIHAMVTKGETGTPVFAMQTAMKDMNEMLALADAHGVSSKVIRAARARYLDAADEGWSEDDAALTAAFGNALKEGS